MSEFLFPKIIWRYWHQGWDNAPFPLKHCTDSIHHYASDFEVIDLDYQSVRNYIDIPPEIDIPNFPIATLSDLIRIKLLEKYGGIWIDATIFLNENLSEFLKPLQGDFFCFFRWEHKVTMSSWFLAAKKGSYIARITSDLFCKKICSNDFLIENEKYFKKWRGSPNYFIFHRTFESLIKSDKKFNEIINLMPFRDSSLVLANMFDGWNKQICLEYEYMILEKSPMIKLSYSVKEENYNPESTLGFLLKKMRGGVYCHNHSHISIGLRTTRIYNSFINRPDKVGQFAGQFESEGDLNICSEKYSKYHVYNFSSTDNRHGAQLLIPHDENRMFLRFQEGNGYSKPREVAFVDDNAVKSFKYNDLEKRLLKVEKRVYPLKRIWRHVKKWFVKE